MSDAQKPERRTRPRATAAFIRGRRFGTLIRVTPPEIPGQIARRQRYEEAAPEHRKPPPVVVTDFARAALAMVSTIRADLASGSVARVGSKSYSYYAAERFWAAIGRAQDQGRPVWSGKAPRFRNGQNHGRAKGT